MKSALKIHSFTVSKKSDVIKRGIYMCKAFAICQKYKIIHRYIKPNNIFVYGSEDFQIGDFSLVRTLKNFLKLMFDLV